MDENLNLKKQIDKEKCLSEQNEEFLKIKLKDLESENRLLKQVKE